MLWALILGFAIVQPSFADDIGTTVNCNSVSPSPDQNSIDDLIDLVNQDGRRERINTTQRPDLKRTVSLAVCIAKKSDSSCDYRRINELRLSNAYGESIVAYEVIAYCEDSPSPAVGVYFDLSKRFLRTLQLAN